MKRNLIIAFIILVAGNISAQCWKSTHSGGQHSLGIKTNGTLWAWGINGLGELGNGSTNDSWSPTQVGTATDWATAAVGHEHSLAIKNNGTLWGWGSNFYGQSGGGIVPGQIGTQTDWKSVSAGAFTSLAIKNDGSLWIWGDNQYGQLGDGTTTPQSSPTMLGTATNWKMADIGWNGHVLALKTDGTLWGWGHNDSGQLGDGTNVDKLTPVQIGSANNWKMISVGSSHSTGLKADGTLWSWGENFVGELGDGTIIDKNLPVQIGSANDWTFVTSGAQGGVAIKTNGELWSWGTNSCLFCSSTNTVPSLVNSNCQFASAGVAGAFEIRTDGNLWSWGDNNFRGQLGNGTVSEPSPMTLIATGNCAVLVGLQTISTHEELLEIYPNPAQNRINVTSGKDQKISIFNVSGTEVLQGETDAGQLDISMLLPGIYFVKCTNSNKNLYYKLLKE